MHDADVGSTICTNRNDEKSRAKNSTIPMYRLEQCMDLVQECTVEELVALSTQVREDWKGYPYSEQKQLLSVMVNRRKQLYRELEPEIVYSSQRTLRMHP